MKKLITLIFLIVSVVSYAQTPVYSDLDVYGKLNVRKNVKSDTIVVGSDTLTNIQIVNDSTITLTINGQTAIIGTTSSDNVGNADSLGGLPASSYLTSEVDGSVTNEIQVLSISNDTIYLSDGGFVKLPTNQADFDTTYIYQAIGAKADTVEWDTSLTTTEDTLLLIAYSRDLQTKDTLKIAKGSLPSSSSDSVLYANRTDTLGGVAASEYLRTSGNLNWNDTILNVEAAFGNNILIGSTTEMGYGSAFNTVLGYEAGLNAGTDADWNTIIGYKAGKSVNNTFNTLIGGFAGNVLTTGSSNTLVGHGVGELLTTGNNNTFIGYNAGKMGGGNGARSGCVFIGYQVGMNNSSDNILSIDNSNTASPLLYGDFSADSLATNGNLTATGDVTAASFGSAFITDTYSASKTVDMSTGQKHKMTVTGDMTINFTNIVEGVVYEFWFTQDGTGGHTVNLGTWNGGTATPFANTGSFNDTASKTASKTTVLQFQSNGSIILYGITTN